MKLTKKYIGTIPFHTFNHHKYGELASINLVLIVLEEDLNSAIKKLKNSPFEDDVIYFDTKVGRHFFIKIKHFYGWLFFNYGTHPILKEFADLSASLIKEKVQLPKMFNQNKKS